MTCRLAKTLVLLFCSTALFSHEFNPAHLVINEEAENEYQVSWMYPIKNIGARAEVFFQMVVKEIVNYQAKKGNIWSKKYF